MNVVPPSAAGRDQRAVYRWPSRSTMAVPAPVLTAYGGRLPASRKRDVRTVVYWITTVAAPSWPPSAALVGLPSIHTSHRLAWADQRNENAAAGYETSKDRVARPPGGAGPNRNPTSRAVLAFLACASSSLVRA